MSLPTSLTDPLAAARAVAAVAAAHVQEHDTQGRLSTPALDALRQAGMPTLALPRRDGGPELPPQQAVAVVRILAAACPSTAWYAAVSSAGSAAAWFLPAQTAARIWHGDIGVVIAGSARPGGRAVPVEDGAQILEGRWEWGSAGDAAEWMHVALELEGRGPVSVFLPRGGFAMEATWDAMGLRASASHAFHAVPGTVVPWALVASSADGNPPPQLDAPLARFSVVTYQSALFAAVALGNADAALADIVALARRKTPLGAASSLASAPVSWREIGRAATRLDGAARILESHLDTLWAQAQTATAQDAQAQAAARAACAEVSATCCEVVQTAFDLAGASAAFRTSPLQRRLRDARVIHQHYYLSPRSLDLYGRIVLEQPLDALEQRSLLRR